MTGNSSVEESHQTEITWPKSATVPHLSESTLKPNPNPNPVASLPPSTVASSSAAPALLASTSASSLALETLSFASSAASPASFRRSSLAATACSLSCNSVARVSSSAVEASSRACNFSTAASPSEACKGRSRVRWGRRGGAYSFVACLSHLTAHPFRDGALFLLLTRDTSNIWALITFFPPCIT